MFFLPLHATIILVSGSSSVGKTSMCQELESLLAKKHKVRAYYWDSDVWPVACKNFFYKHKRLLTKQGVAESETQNIFTFNTSINARNNEVKDLWKKESHEVRTCVLSDMFKRIAQEDELYDFTIVDILYVSRGKFIDLSFLRSIASRDVFSVSVVATPTQLQRNLEKRNASSNTIEHREPYSICYTKYLQDFVVTTQARDFTNNRFMFSFEPGSCNHSVLNRFVPLYTQHEAYPFLRKSIIPLLKSDKPIHVYSKAYFDYGVVNRVGKSIKDCASEVIKSVRTSDKKTWQAIKKNIAEFAQ